MSFLNALNISGSALTAQRLRLDIVSENISNIETTRTAGGDGPYRRKVVQFQALGDQSDFRAFLGRAVRERFTGLGDTRNMGRLNPAFDLTRKGEAGVIVSQIFEDETPFRLVYDPTHPDADEYGYLRLPNVDLLKEVIDSMSASRSYEANVTALNAVKMMASKALEVGR